MRLYTAIAAILSMMHPHRPIFRDEVRRAHTSCGTEGCSCISMTEVIFENVEDVQGPFFDI